MTAEHALTVHDAMARILLEGYDGRTATRYLLQDGDTPDATSAIVRRWKQTGLQIGRSSSNDIALSSPVVSRQHAVLMRSDDELVVIDLRSSNGTFVDGERIEPGRPVTLYPGSELSFGHGAVLTVAA